MYVPLHQGKFPYQTNQRYSVLKQSVRKAGGPATTNTVGPLMENTGFNNYLDC